jgi:hypothetical protein
MNLLHIHLIFHYIFNKLYQLMRKQNHKIFFILFIIPYYYYLIYSLINII